MLHHFWEWKNWFDFWKECIVIFNAPWIAGYTLNRFDHFTQFIIFGNMVTLAGPNLCCTFTWISFETHKKLRESGHAFVMCFYFHPSKVHSIRKRLWRKVFSVFAFLTHSGLGSVVRATDRLFVRMSDDEELVNCLSGVTHSGMARQACLFKCVGFWRGFCVKGSQTWFPSWLAPQTRWFKRSTWALTTASLARSRSLLPVLALRHTKAGGECNCQGTWNETRE